MLRLLLLEREDGELSRLLVRLDEDLSRGGVFNRDELTIGGELAISGELALFDDLRGGRSRVCIGVWSCNDGDCGVVGGLLLLLCLCLVLLLLLCFCLSTLAAL